MPSTGAWSSPETSCGKAYLGSTASTMDKWTVGWSDILWRVLLPAIPSRWTQEVLQAYSWSFSTNYLSQVSDKRSVMVWGAITSHNHSQLEINGNTTQLKDRLTKCYNRMCSPSSNNMGISSPSSKITHQLIVLWQPTPFLLPTTESWHLSLHWPLTSTPSNMYGTRLSGLFMSWIRQQRPLNSLLMLWSMHGTMCHRITSWYLYIPCCNGRTYPLLMSFLCLNCH